MPVSEQLAESRVLVVGAGALGCVAAAQLAGSGVGLLGVVDPATLERSDLPGQSLLSAPDPGGAKACAHVTDTPEPVT
jgi:molybdopterin/thiamine biosynthesis adenylyltransferase